MTAAKGQEALLHGDLTHNIIGAFFEVHRVLGYGFLESVYKRAMYVALLERGISCEREVPFTVFYKGNSVGEYRADLLAEGKVMIETKTGEKLSQVHDAQSINYLKVSGIQLCLLLNFGPEAIFKRLIWTSEHSHAVPPRASAS